MTDTDLIWKFLAREFPDSHQAIYLYCKGRLRAPQTAYNQIMPITLKTFSPPLKKVEIEEAVKTFLDYKKAQSIKGEIVVKPIYG